MNDKNSGSATEIIDIAGLNIDREIQDFLFTKGIPVVPREMALDLGEIIMVYVNKSAEKLAKKLHQE